MLGCMKRLAISLLLLCSACKVTIVADDDKTPVVTPKTVGGLTAGTRLQITHASDGTSEFPLAFYDVDTQSTCAPQKLNGELRCWPVPTAVYTYADAACTQPIVYTKTAECNYPGVTNKYVVKSEPTACTSATQFYLIGEKVAAPAKLYSKFGSSTCSEYLSPSIGDEFHAVGAEAPGTTFVRFSEVDESDLQSTLTVAALQSEDGARFTARGVQFIVPLAAPLTVKNGTASCSPLRASDGKTRCMPQPLAYISATPTAFSDAACTAPAVQVPVAQCAQEVSNVFGRTLQASNGCFAGYEFLEAGPVLASAYSNFGTCSAVTPSSTSYRALGSTIPPGTFPELTAYAFGSGRLQVQMLKSGNIFLPAGGYGLTAVDTQLGTECQVFPIGAEYRCFPTTASVRYLDGACTVPVATVYSPDCVTNLPKYASQTLPVASACSVWTQKYFALGAKQANPSMVYEKMENGTCSSGFAPNPADAFYALGAEVPLSTFATLVTATSN